MPKTMPRIHRSDTVFRKDHSFFIADFFRTQKNITEMDDRRN